MNGPLSRALPLENGGRSPFAPGSATPYLFVIAGMSAMPIALAKAGLEIALFEFGMLGGLLAFSAWIAWCLRGRGLARLATALEAWALFHAANIILALTTFVAGTSRQAFFDAPLAQADRMLLPGFDWPAAMLWFSKSGLPVQIANLAYQSLLWQPTLLIITLALMAANDRMWRFLMSWIATVLIVIGIFYFYPALGAHPYFSVTQQDVPAMLEPIPWVQPVLLHGLREGSLGTLSPGQLAGIISFPSFHAGAAVLLAHGFWPNRILRWPFLALNTLMLASAAPIGGHYMIDLLAGIIVALVGIVAATWAMTQSLRFRNHVFNMPRLAALRRSSGSGLARTRWSGPQGGYPLSAGLRLGKPLSGRAGR